MEKFHMEKINKKREREYNRSPFDVHRCFHIGDSRVSDEVMVMKDGSRVSGVVTAVDLKNVMISYQEEDGSEHEAGINDIVFLGDSRSGYPSNNRGGGRGNRSAYDRG